MVDETSEKKRKLTLPRWNISYSSATAADAEKGLGFGIGQLYFLFRGCWTILDLKELEQKLFRNEL